MLLRRAAPGYQRAIRAGRLHRASSRSAAATGAGRRPPCGSGSGDEMMHTAAEGDGPVNALDRAVRKALLPHYPDAGRGPPGGLQGPHRGRAPGDRRAAPRHHRVGPRGASAGAPSGARRTSSRRAGWRCATGWSWRCCEAGRSPAVSKGKCPSPEAGRGKTHGADPDRHSALRPVVQGPVCGNRLPPAVVTSVSEVPTLLQRWP